MAVNILIVYYSAYGHIYRMSQEVKKELEAEKKTEVKMVKVPEFEAARENLSTQEAYVKAQKRQEEVPRAQLKDLEEADGIIWGIPTRFGNMPSQIKQFIDQ